MIHRGDDPIADFHRWDADQQKYLDSLPLCENCEEPIQDEKCYEIGGEVLCEDCMKDRYERWTEDFVMELNDGC